tara:strand:+ start:3531 stop:4127 length:597 start_codon:yes stop_codon:yes gene_type:complete
MSIIAIEGPCAAGKSSCIQQLTRRSGVHSIREYNDYSYSPPTFPPTSIKMTWDGMKIFETLEEQRLVDLGNILEGSNPTHVLLDRSFLTILAFRYGIIPVTGINIQEEIELHWINSSLKILPDIVIILDVSHSQQLKRVYHIRDRYLPILLDQTFNLRSVQYMIDFCTRHRIRYLYIDTDEKSIKDICHRIAEYTSLR